MGKTIPLSEAWSKAAVGKFQAVVEAGLAVASKVQDEGLRFCFVLRTSNETEFL